MAGKTFPAFSAHAQPEISRIWQEAHTHGVCSCEGMDSVTINIFIDNMPHVIGVYCGNMQPPMLMSSNSRMDVTCTAITDPTAAMGFNATYNFGTGEVMHAYLCS